MKVILSLTFLLSGCEVPPLRRTIGCREYCELNRLTGQQIPCDCDCRPRRELCPKG